MKAVLFDLDGTLLDTRDMILDSFRYAYTKVFGPEALPPDDQLLSMIGIPLKQQMEIISPEHSEELFDAYFENNQRVHDTMLKDFEGIADALERIKQTGLRMAVVTSKRHEPARRGLEKMGLLDFFEFILGADDTAEHKPDPGPLLAGAEIMQLEPADCAYVGDSPYDMQASRAAGMYTVGVLWGMFTQQELIDSGAEIMVEKVTDLPGVFEKQR